MLNSNKVIEMKYNNTNFDKYKLKNSTYSNQSEIIKYAINENN